MSPSPQRTLALTGLCLALSLVAAGCSDSSSGGGGAPPPPASPTPTNPPNTGSVTITAIEPAVGHPSGGELVRLTGTGFSPQASVTFGSAPATVLQADNTTMIVSTPAGIGSQTVTVVNGADQGTSSYAYEVSSGTDVFRFKAGTDKWFVNLDFTPEADADNTGIADLSEALASAENNSGGVGFTDFETAATQVLSFVAQFYRNNPDGTLAPGGQPISFRRSPAPFGAVPGTGGFFAPTSVADYNLMPVRNVAFLGPGEEQAGPTGRALAENFANQTVENDGGGTTPGGQSADPALGTFCDAVVFFWNAGAIPRSRRTLSEFTEEIAAVAAHEIGHSVGLVHTNVAPPPPADENLMSAVNVLNPVNVYAFDDGTYATLAGYMPGPARSFHRSAWSPLRLIQNSDAVVIATPRQLEDGVLDIPVTEALKGSLTADDYVRVLGFDPAVTLTPQELAAEGPTVLFLGRTAAGWSFEQGEASAMLLAGHDTAEWRQLIADYVALEALAGAARQTAYCQRLATSLSSGDRQIRADALHEMLVDRTTCQAMTAAQANQVLTIVQDPARDPAERALASLFFVHRQDPSVAPALATTALASDDRPLLEALAGALEMSLGGLQAAAEALVAQLGDSPSAAQQERALVVRGWLQDASAVAGLSERLSLADAAAREAADLLGRIGSTDAVPALRAVASDVTRDWTTRRQAYRALGRIGGGEVRAWLSEQEAAMHVGSQREAVRFARDWAQTWKIR